MIAEFLPHPRLRMGVTGTARAVEHFGLEWGAARAAPGGATDLDIEVRTHGGRPPTGADGHKTVRWVVDAGSPERAPLHARVDVFGRPRRFAFSLLQGWLVEPMASVAAARRDLVLLPGAALHDGDGATVLLGRSGAGKTSVVARTLAAGGSALADDQVLVDVDGVVAAWPRRLRVYPDLRATAPAAVRALPWRRRTALGALRGLQTVTRGWVAPSLPVPWADLGATPAPAARARRVVVVQRAPVEALQVAELGAADVAAVAQDVLGEQRLRLVRMGGPPWEAAAAAAAEHERATLLRALDGVPAQRWSVPAAWDAPRAVAALADRLAR